MATYFSVGTKRMDNAPQSSELREAVLSTLRPHPWGVDIQQIVTGVRRLLREPTPESTIRSYLQLETPRLFTRSEGERYCLARLTHQAVSEKPPKFRTSTIGKATVIRADCLDWLAHRLPASIHAVVTDPPYSLVEYSAKDQRKLREGKGGVWRLPPAFDGAQRSPLPRFTVLSEVERQQLCDFFVRWATLLAPALVPGANVVVATSPLLSYIVAGALAQAGLERRGEIARLVTTMRGGDRPKGAHEEFAGVSVMPRSMWEPWLLFRKPIEGRVQDNLRKWRTGGFRRLSEKSPFGDVIRSAPTHKVERALAPHPTLKPQEFMRPLVRGVLPLGEGVVLDPFCGAGSTLAAATAVGYASIGVEKDKDYFELAEQAIPRLVSYQSGRQQV